MFKLIHLTDPHFVPPGKTLYGRDPSKALAAAVADINENHADADLVVLTGDLTHWGEEAAFRHLQRTLKPLAPPLRLLVGNHDHRGRFAASFPDQPRDADGFVQSALRTGEGRMLFLDTVLEGTDAGWYCETRQAWLADQLDQAAAKGDDVFLFMHHPPFDVGLAPMDRIGLVQRDAFRALVEPHRGRIRHLFFGHLHRPIFGTWRGMGLSTIRALNHQVSLDFAAQDHTPGCFEPPAYAVCLIEPDQLTIHVHDFLDDSPRFSLDDSPVGDWANAYPTG